MERCWRGRVLTDTSQRDEWLEASLELRGADLQVARALGDWNTDHLRDMEPNETGYLLLWLEHNWECWSIFLPCSCFPKQVGTTKKSEGSLAPVAFPWAVRV